MTVLKRWAIVAFAAATVVAAAAGDSGKVSDSDRQERRQLIEQMSQDEKQQLFEKQDRFSNLPPDKQEQLRQLHLHLQDQENREELERVMKAYFNWVTSPMLSTSERSQLKWLSSPQERVKRVAELKAAHGRRTRRPGSFPRPPFGWDRPGRGGFSEFMREYREYADNLKTWAAQYTIDHADELADLLPSGEREKWKASLKAARPQGTDGNQGGLKALLSWYLAGPSEAPRILDADVAEFENSLSPDTKKILTLPPDKKIGDLQSKLRGLLRHEFASGAPDLKNVVSSDELQRFHKGLSQDQQDNLDRLPREGKEYMLRWLYFNDKCKLSSRSFDDRDFRFPFGGGGGPPHSDPRRGGSRGPGSEFRFEGQRPDRMPPDRPGGPPMPPDERDGGEQARPE